MIDLILVLVTFPSMESARQIGTALVEKQLAACVNFIPGIESIYRWQGKIEFAAEVLAIIKTSTAALEVLEREVRCLHPYELPEFIVIKPASAGHDYLAWVLDNVRSASP